MTQKPRVLSLGAHILDTLVRPVEEIPAGQGGRPVEQIVVTAAGTAGGTALVLSKLGTDVVSGGAVGSDVTGDLLITLLSQAGVDTSLLGRSTTAPTSASVLPIRPDGSRPAFHVRGAGAELRDHIPWSALEHVQHVHLGAPELLGADDGARVLRAAKAAGCTTSVDSLARGESDFLRILTPMLPMVDFIMPNDEQAIGWTGAGSLADAAQALVDLGAGTAVVTSGGHPTVIADAQGHRLIPVFDVPVVDTTGCGDSFSAGFLHALLDRGESPDEAALFGAATAAQVVQGLGTSFGDFDAAAVAEFRARAPRRRMEDTAHA